MSEKKIKLNKEQIGDLKSSKTRQESSEFVKDRLQLSNEQLLKVSGGEESDTNFPEDSNSNDNSNIIYDTYYEYDPTDNGNTSEDFGFVIKDIDI